MRGKGSRRPLLTCQQIVLAAKRTGGLRLLWHDVLLLAIDVQRAQLAEADGDAESR